LDTYVQASMKNKRRTQSRSVKELRAPVKKANPATENSKPIRKGKEHEAA
jgi:hypothetical protein